jgi:hypothetical protein
MWASFLRDQLEEIFPGTVKFLCSVYNKIYPYLPEPLKNNNSKK